MNPSKLGYSVAALVLGNQRATQAHAALCRGLVDDEMFFENAGEAFLVYDRIRGLLPAMRAAYQNPHLWAQLETLGKRMEAWHEKRAPGHVAAMRQRMARMRPVAAKTASE